MDKKPFVTLEQLKEITKTYPTPFHLYDEKGIRENAERLKRAFSWNKGVLCSQGNTEPVYHRYFKETGLRSGLFLPDGAYDGRGHGI